MGRVSGEEEHRGGTVWATECERRMSDKEGECWGRNMWKKESMRGENNGGGRKKGPTWMNIGEKGNVGD